MGGRLTRRELRVLQRWEQDAYSGSPPLERERIEFLRRLTRRILTRGSWNGVRPPREIRDLLSWLGGSWQRTEESTATF